MKPAHLTAALPISISAAALISVGLLFLAGCATSPQPAPAETVPEVAPPPQPEPPPEPVPVPTPATVKPSPRPPVVTGAPPVEPALVEPVPHVSEKLKIRIESNPAGTMIVVDGKPVGRTPLEYEVESANNGFFKGTVTIRARFVADDAALESVSIDEELGPLERVPLALVFSRDGVQRILRQH